MVKETTPMDRGLDVGTRSLKSGLVRLRSQRSLRRGM